MSKIDKLEPKDILWIKTIHADNSSPWDRRMVQIGEKFDVSERTVRRWIAKLGLSSYVPNDTEQLLKAKSREYDPQKKYIIFTWGQNATPVYKPFWDNLVAYGIHLGAAIHVLAGRYRNPSILGAKVNDEWWDDPIFPYLDAARQEVHPCVTSLGDVKIVPTASSPLSGMEGMTGEKTCIVGHPRLHLKVLPALEGHNKKLLLTSGACTIPNYTDSKSGKKAAFHHVYGFVIVEIKDKNVYYIRQVSAAADGSFTDLIWNVSGKETKRVYSCAGAILGDIHLSQIDEKIFNKTQVLLSAIKPEHIVLHDLFDAYSVNHHVRKNPVEQYRRFVSKKDLLSTEISEMKDWVAKLFAKNSSKILVVKSNHDDMLDRWIRDQNWKDDVRNSVEYMDYAKALLLNEADKGVIPYILEKEFPSIICLDANDSYKIKDFEIAQHGHIGANGSKGSASQFRKLNTKLVTGHSHVPLREDNLLVVGATCKLRQDYNLGPSSWANAHVLIHNDGKAQHIIFNGDNFTTFVYTQGGN